MKKKEKVKTGKPWSKATAAQRKHHRKRCQEAGELRRHMNLVHRICDAGRKAGIDGLEFLSLFHLLTENKKLPLKDSQNDKVHDLLKQKMPAVEIYKTLFGAIENDGEKVRA